MDKLWSAFVAVVLLAGCNLDNQKTKIQYMPDMADSPAVKAQESFLDPPEGSIALTSAIYPKTIEEAEKVLTMPPSIASDPQVVDKGKALFNTFCIPCHGAKALGDGTVVGPGLFPQPPNITQKLYLEKGDGFFFYRITFGTSIMPAYGYAISVNERWQIISYLRTLQKAAQ